MMQVCGVLRPHAFPSPFGHTEAKFDAFPLPDCKDLEGVFRELSHSSLSLTFSVGVLYH